jgi:zinc protease
MRFLPLLFSAVLLAGCSSGSHTPSQSLPDPLKLDVTSFKLSNGLQVLVMEDDRLPVYSLYTFYKVGGKDERKGITGASHFLEHLMFKGTKTVAASKFDYMVEGNGGSSNAYTTNDMTVYHENMPTSTLELMLGVEADRMVNLVIKKDEFEQERQVVQEERKMRYENSPKGQVYLRTMEELFKGTPYGTSVIGDIDDLKTVSRDQIYRYYRQWYAPNNATLVVVGDVKAGKVKDIVEKQFGELAASDVPEQSRASVPSSAFVTQVKAPVELNLKGQSSSPLFMLSYPAAPAGAPEAFAQDILSSALGDGKSAHLVQKYVLSKRPKVASIYAANYTLEKAGMFMVGGELVRGVDLKNFKENLVKELSGSCNTAITENAIQKVKNQYEAELFRQLDTSAGLAQFIGDRQSLYGDWAYYRKELQIYRGLTVKDVQGACQRLFAQPGHVWVTVWEKNSGSAQ